MLINAFKKFFFSDSATSRFQDNVFEFTEQFQQNPFIKGNMLTDQTITTSDTKLSHGLGTTPQGFFVAKTNVGATIYLVSSDENYLTVKASVAVKANLWVF